MTDYTPEQVMGAIHQALVKRDMPAVADLLCYLATIDPTSAETIRDAIYATEDQRRAMRGAFELAEQERLREEYRDERADWWTS